eukprot:1158508-Pelagomonas_calceolata.AAC.19
MTSTVYKVAGVHTKQPMHCVLGGKCAHAAAHACVQAHNDEHCMLDRKCAHKAANALRAGWQEYTHSSPCVCASAKR